MSPKSLLRHKLAVSTLEDLAHGQFQTVIPEVDAIKPADVTHVILCGGKVYYDLLEKRRELNRDDVAIIRIEQLYPFPEKKLAEALAPYKKAKSIVWCQEEPMNQGAWFCSQHHIHSVVREWNDKLRTRYAGRPSSAAPACGSVYLHAKEQAALVEDALKS
jgi:2-oxoglutarate dehydrogenase E1 component